MELELHSDLHDDGHALADALRYSIPLGSNFCESIGLVIATSVISRERRSVAQCGDADLRGGRVRRHPSNVDATALVVVERGEDAVPNASKLAPAAASSVPSRLEDLENG